MKTKEIIKLIKDSGGFNNWRHWTIKEVATWVRYNFDCSYSVSINVAKKIR